MMITNLSTPKIQNMEEFSGIAEVLDDGEVGNESQVKDIGHSTIVPESAKTTDVSTLRIQFLALKAEMETLKKKVTTFESILETMDRSKRDEVKTVKTYDVQLPGTPPRLSAKSKEYCTPSPKKWNDFSRPEDDCILEYIKDNELHCSYGINSGIWEKLLEKHFQLLGKHTASSLHNRFVKTILKNLGRYIPDTEERVKFEMSMERSPAKKKRKLQFEEMDDVE